MHTIGILVVLASVGYSVYKHLTLADVKAELVKIESEIASGVIAEEVKAVYAVIIARLKALL